jgi:hypothetical protein
MTAASPACGVAAITLAALILLHAADMRRSATESD